MENFIYNAQPGRVLFCSGTLSQLPQEADRLGLQRVLVLSTPQQEEQANSLVALLGDNAVGAFAGATMHTPVSVTERALAVVSKQDVDGLVAVGGGSTTGLAKAIALRTDLPQIVIPTTYAGSEMTPIVGETADGRKVTQSSPKVLPEVVIYDVDLTTTLPVSLSVCSGINAIAHAVEALYARDRNPIVSMIAAAGIRSLFQSLSAIAEDPSNKEARSRALYGAWLCGVCLGSVGMALHHKICHTLGGAFGLPHAETHVAVLPHALRYNESVAREAIETLRQSLDHEDPARALFDLARNLGADMALKNFGMSADDIEKAVDAALENPYWNPRPLEREGLRRLVVDAFEGNFP
jgi:maleylacetate reductase